MSNATWKFAEQVLEQQPRTILDRLRKRPGRLIAAAHRTVTITLQDDPAERAWTIVTDRDGRFEIDLPCSGEYVLVASPAADSPRFQFSATNVSAFSSQEGLSK